MMYPFMTLDDDTEIVHSEMKPDGRVKGTLKNRMQKIVSTQQCAGCRAMTGRRCTASRWRRSRGIRRSWSPPRI